MNRKENKYEAIDMLDLNDKVEDIIDIYISRIYHTDKTVGIIVNKEFAEYIMGNLLDFDDTSVKEIDLVDRLNTNEYLVSVDNDGYVTVLPIEEFKIIDNTDILYIDMDGDIEQNIIDYCVNEDKEVILFSQEDNCECDGECKNCPVHDENYLHTSEDENGNAHGFTASRSDGDSYMSYSYYSSDELSHEDIQKMLKAFGF